jgi:F-type H+-transporting ATPase subunit epsilon
MLFLDVKILVPHRVFWRERAGRLRAEGAHGVFCVLPRHIDCVVNLVPGILLLENENGEECSFAVDGGTFVKRGEEVLVSTPHAARSEEVGGIRSAVRESFRELEDRERTTRSALAKIEADFVRKFIEIEEDGGVIR